MFMHEANFMARFLEGKRRILHKNDGYCPNLKAPNGTVQLYRRNPFSVTISYQDTRELDVKMRHSEQQKYHKSTSTAITTEHVTS